MALIPATIITGFLGAGKTTLLKRLLSEAHGQKIAVIENEFGEENIDNEILVETEENIFQMNNGCVCCSIREDLRSTLSDLAQRQQKGELHFDRVVIETTGLADPGPVAQTFFMDDDVAQAYLLDSIITLVDAKHAMQQLDERQEAQRQVGFADRILISKTDLINPQEYSELQQRLHQINPRAPQKAVHFGEAPLAEIFDLRGFNLDTTLEFTPNFLQESEHVHGPDCAPDCGHEHHDHEHSNGHEHHDHSHEHGKHAHHHRHDDDVKSFVFRAKRPFKAELLEDFISALLNIYGPRMLRYKGVLWMQGVAEKVIFQGVHQLMGSDLGPAWQADEEKESKMVFIGINLPKDIFFQGLEQCLEDAQPQNQ